MSRQSFVDYVTPNPTWISSLLLWYLFILNFMNLSWQHGAFCLFCKMVINKTILMTISLSNRRCRYEFIASIDCWIKTTSHYDVMAPSTVSTIQNAKLLTSRNLCHSLMLFHVTRSRRMGECETPRRPTRIRELVEPSRLRRNRRSCRKWITRDPPQHMRHINAETMARRNEKHLSLGIWCV